ncbi:dynein axonemal assembly factor 8-like isoform X3 [Engystomops pustulosus]|uniref:dynein axonemal assembly factor 8-like isoform X3 n=1 Tax=Engystomops pustulosus TaxID=76066 RepID=UPI003AFAAACC
MMASSDDRQKPAMFLADPPGAHELHSLLSSVKPPSLGSDTSSLSDLESEDVEIFQRDDCHLSDVSDDEHGDFINKILPSLKIDQKDGGGGGIMAPGSIISPHIPDLSSSASDYLTASHPNIEGILGHSPPHIPSHPTETDVISPETDNPETDNIVTSGKGPREDETGQGEIELFPLPAIQLIDQEDLETILERLTDEVKLQTSARDPVAPSSALSIENNAKKRQEQIMAQLLDLSAKQSQAKTPHQCLNGEHVDRRGAIPASCDSRTNVNKNVVDKGRHTEDSPTVFIDLRVTASSPSLMTDGGRAPIKNPGRAHVPQYVPIHTGKSALLRQLRNHKTGPPSPSPHRNAQLPDISQPPKKIRTRSDQTLNVPSDVTQEKEVVLELDVSLKEGDAREEHPSKKDKEPIKTQEVHSTEEQSRREKHEREKRSRQNMQSQLEGMRPRSSVSGGQPMAEQTPLLFHREASYSPEIDTLPARSGAELLLVTVWLSSCGQVLMPGHQMGRSVLSSPANVYNALLVWLLSMVASLHPDYEGDAPFQVLGLQQMWREEGLAVYACVSPSELPAPKSTKMRRHKGKEDFRGTSDFYRQVSLFLSHHTLQSVTPWRDSVIQQLQGELFPLNLEVPGVKLNNIVSVNPDPQAVEKVFSSPSGFFWQTLETEEKLSSLAPEFSLDGEIEVVPVIMYGTLLRNSVAFYHALHLILTGGLDICGVRLLYPEASALPHNISTVPPSYAGSVVRRLPILAMALRGSHAGRIWESIAGPCDPQLARQTDQNSLSALYGLTRESPLLHYSRTSGSILKDLSLWFGGRIPSSGVVSTRVPNTPGRNASPRSWSSAGSECRPPALLTATTRGDVFLVVSPIVPPCAYGDVIDTCCQRGFAIHGIRRLRLSAKHGALLNMSAAQVPIFCSIKPSTHPEEKLNVSVTKSHLHCLLLLLRKENAARNTPALLQGLMNDLAEQGLLGLIRSNLLHPEHLDHNMCFHVVSYSDSLLQSLGGSLHSVPDSSTVWHMQSRQPFSFDPELEQVVVLTISGRQALQKAGCFLRQILRPKPKIQETVTGTGFQGFELLGVKWMPSLSWVQATAVTPYEVGEHPWQESVNRLASSPALVCALRRVQAFSTLANAIKELVPATAKQQAQVIMSATPEVAFRQAVHFFTEKDLVSDSQGRPVLKYIAPPGTRGGGEHKGHSDSIFTYMLSGPPPLFTLLLLKPGSWSRNLGKILRKIVLQRFVLVGMKMVTLTPEDSLQVIPTGEVEDKHLCQTHCDYLTSGPSLVLCLQRINAVLKLLDLLGPDDPQKCKAVDQFLWRAQYGTSTVHNAMYGSRSYQAAIREIKRFFPEGLVCDHSSIVLEAEKIPKMTHDALFTCRTQRKTMKNQPRNGGLSPNTGTPLTSALCQTTCLLFPSRALGGSSPAYIQRLEQLSNMGFSITAARMTVFDQSQAQFVAELYSLQDSLSAEFKAGLAGPCLLVAAQRDNAVTCFHSLMGSQDLQKVQDRAAFILSPQSQRQALRMISCFFDSLTPDSIHQIVPAAS